MSLFGADRPHRVTNAHGVIAHFMRAKALASDDAGHDLRELAFKNWRAETVFPAAVDSWLRAVAENSK